MSRDGLSAVLRRRHASGSGLVRSSGGMVWHPWVPWVSAGKRIGFQFPAQFLAGPHCLVRFRVCISSPRKGDSRALFFARLDSLPSLANIYRWGFSGHTPACFPRCPHCPGSVIGTCTLGEGCLSSCVGALSCRTWRLMHGLFPAKLGLKR